MHLDADLAASQSVLVTIPAARGIILPMYGVPRNSKDVRISTPFVEGIVSPTPLTNVTGVAVVGPTFWEYQHAEALGFGWLQVNPKPSTPNPQPLTLNPKPWTLNPKL